MCSTTHNIASAFERMNAAQARSDAWEKAKPLILTASIIAALCFGAWLDHVVFPKLAGL